MRLSCEMEIWALMLGCEIVKNMRKITMKLRNYYVVCDLLRRRWKIEDLMGVS